MQGRIASPGRVVINFPRAIWSRLKLASVGKVTVHPWISYDATKRIDQFMAAAPRSVLEFGSGNSTLWFASRAESLHSVEHDPQWYETVQRRLANVEKRGAVFHELHQTEEKYSNFRADYKGFWDVILIDGIWRLPSASKHVDKLAPDGILYLDNSDVDASADTEGEIPELLVFLDEWAKQTKRTVEIYTDFSPTVLHATQGRFYTDKGA